MSGFLIIYFTDSSVGGSTSIVEHARLVPLYLAEMAALQVIHQEFMDGNFAINKNQIPFCAIGRIVNRIMKVTGGLVGITQNASAP